MRPAERTPRIRSPNGCPAPIDIVHRPPWATLWMVPGTAESGPSRTYGQPHGALHPPRRMVEQAAQTAIAHSGSVRQQGPTSFTASART